MNTTPFEKLKASLRAKLTGLAMIEPKYYQCVRALELGSEIHVKLRKDGVTPEFYHQLNMLSYSLTFHNSLIDPAKVYTCILLHDAYEDYPEWIERLEKEFPEDMIYIKRISKIIFHKNPDGTYTSIKKDKKAYMAEMANCHVTSIAKGIDRIHNLSTMKGVFKLKKQISYYKEAREHFLPMLKAGRRRFLEQETVYEALKSVMNLLVDNTEHFIENIRGGKDDYADCLKQSS
jgi:(p)ppGpp synthase/HD superfamily hydrolase